MRRAFAPGPGRFQGARQRAEGTVGGSASIRFLGTILALALLLWCSSLEASCLGYEPLEAKLGGTIVRKTFPGPPNYESVEAGDAPEVCWVLLLDSPACVEGAKGDEVNVSEGDLRDMQLVLSKEQYGRYKDMVGKKVVVTGTLFHAVTGHHFTTVLVTVTGIERQR